jgi:hypothetical protein
MVAPAFDECAKAAAVAGAFLFDLVQKLRIP